MVIGLSVGLGSKAGGEVKVFREGFLGGGGRRNFFFLAILSFRAVLRAHMGYMFNVARRFLQRLTRFLARKYDPPPLPDRLHKSLGSRVTIEQSRSERLRARL